MGLSPAPPARLLICGFGPFPGAPVNPTEAVVRALAEEGWRPPRAEARYLVLPVLWDAAPALVLESVMGWRCDGVLLTGLALRARTFRVETLARNRVAPRPDAAGTVPASDDVVEGGPRTLAATAPADRMLSRLTAAGLAAEASTDAGDYLCNSTFYRLLAAEDAPPAGFLHAPPVGPGLGLDEIARAVRACALAFCETPRPDPSPRPA